VFITSLLLFKPFFGLAYASTYTSFLIYDNQYIQLIANYSGPDPEGFYTYSYTLSYDFEDKEKYAPIKYLRIENPYRISVIKLASPRGWGFKYSSSYGWFRWRATNSDYFLYSEGNHTYVGNLDNFEIKSKGKPSFVKAGVWKKDSSITISYKSFNGAKGLTIGPTPEPSSVFLLSLGLFGLRSLLRKKYF